MEQPTAERRLAAIMFTDIVGYTSLTGADEEKAIRVRERHRAIVRPLVEQFEGELIEATGDESLATFPSAVLAVDCALAIQAALRDDDELRLRIGIHLGDVVRRGGEVIGDGVNVASRIRPLAQPRGICVSEQVYALVRNRSHVRASSLGPQPLKNVEQRVTVYALETGAPTGGTRSRARRIAVGIGAMALTLALAYGVYVPYRAAILASVALTVPRIFGDPIEQKIGFATTTDGVRIAYATTGEGPPLVFVLGWATHRERGIGSPLYDAAGWISWHSKDRTLVRYDGRGFGLSDRNVDDFSLDARVRDLEAVVETLGLERFPIYAVSAGGPTAIAYTARHPERVSALVFAGTMAGFRPMDAEEREQWAGMVKLFRTSWDSPIVRSMMVTFLAPDADEVTQRIMSEFLRVSGEGPAVAGFFEEGLRTDTTALARGIRVPTLVIHGQNDSAVPLSLGTELASLIPGARFEILKGADHGMGTVGSPKLAEMITAFLAEDASG
jgi:class 3 adenylate cyclase/pimeloyl-ACP methyl ester carboxylesterase